MTSNRPKLRLNRDTVRHLTTRAVDGAAGFRTEEICVKSEVRTDCLGPTQLGAYPARM